MLKLQFYWGKLGFRGMIYGTVGCSGSSSSRVVGPSPAPAFSRFEPFFFPSTLPTGRAQQEKEEEAPRAPRDPHKIQGLERDPHKTQGLEALLLHGNWDSLRPQRLLHLRPNPNRFPISENLRAPTPQGKTGPLVNPLLRYPLCCEALNGKYFKQFGGPE